MTTKTMVLGKTAIPAYQGGRIACDIYNCGPGKQSDENGITDEDSKMLVVSGTGPSEFENYISHLVSAGFAIVSKRNTDGNIYCALENAGQLYYMYYTAYSNQVRIIEDNSSDTFTDSLPASSRTADNLSTDNHSSGCEFYSCKIPYTHGEGKTNPDDYWRIDCGARIVIKHSDGGLVIIDGGHERQSHKTQQEEFMSMLYRITGQNAGTKLHIKSWFFSHAHGDHVFFASQIMKNYHACINLESVAFNFPSYHFVKDGYDPDTFTMKQSLNTYFPNCKYVKLHTGQVFTLGEVCYSVLYTHEDTVDSQGITPIRDFNDTSTVLKLSIGGKSIMLLADGSGLTAETLLKMYKSETIKSDCLQVAHHGYNRLQELYTAIAAPLAFYANSEENARLRPEKFNDVVSAAPSVKVLYADQGTVKITLKSGEFFCEPAV